MSTQTLKQLRNAAIVGLIFGIALNISNFMNHGVLGGLGQFIYIFFLLGGTFFITGYLLNKRGRDTRNLRIFATKMQLEGILKLNDIAIMVPLAGKDIKGWIYLTDKFLIFASNPDPELIGKKALRLSLAKIKNIENYKPTPFTNDGIRVTLKDGKNYEFLVARASKWVSSIEEGINNRQHKK